MEKENILIDPTVLACFCLVSEQRKTQTKDWGMGFLVLAEQEMNWETKNPLPALLLGHFSHRLWLLFFAPKPHKNACYAGYNCAGF